jgi:hypothetical protein
VSFTPRQFNSNDLLTEDLAQQALQKDPYSLFENFDIKCALMSGTQELKQEAFLWVISIQSIEWFLTNESSLVRSFASRYLLPIYAKN